MHNLLIVMLFQTCVIFILSGKYKNKNYEFMKIMKTNWINKLK